MARRCGVTGKGVMTGNNVSHAHNKTRRRFLPNMQATSVYSEALDRMVRLRLSANGLRTIEHNGGLDNFLIGAKVRNLSPDLRRLRKRIEQARSPAP